MVNQRKHIPNFLSDVFHTIQIQNFNHQNRNDFFCKKLFFFARLNRFLYFRGFWPVGSLITRFLCAGFYCSYDHILLTLELLRRLLTCKILAIIKLIDQLTDLVTNIIDICSPE